MPSYQITCLEKDSYELEKIQPIVWRPSREKECLTGLTEGLNTALKETLSNIMRNDRTVLWRPFIPIAAVIFDMDSTLIGQETIVEIARAIGIDEEVAKITEDAMQGKIDFEQALRARVALLEGVSTHSFADIAKRLVLNPGIEEVSNVLFSKGIPVHLVSGGFQYFANAFAKLLHFSGCHANALQTNKDVLTGKLDGPIVCEQAKLRYAKGLIENEKIDRSQLLAIGDGANDIPMLDYAGCGFGYRPKKQLYGVVSGAMQLTHRPLLDFIDPPKF